MSKYSEGAVLIHQTFTVDDIGQEVVQETVLREVFVNPYVVGAQAYYSAAQAGLRPECDLQMRTDEYAGESFLVFRGNRLKVLRVVEQGEYSRLVCERVNADV